MDLGIYRARRWGVLEPQPPTDQRLLLYVTTRHTFPKSHYATLKV